MIAIFLADQLLRRIHFFNNLKRMGKRHDTVGVTVENENVPKTGDGFGKIEVKPQPRNIGFARPIAVEGPYGAASDRCGHGYQGIGADGFRSRQANGPAHAAAEQRAATARVCSQVDGFHGRHQILYAPLQRGDLRKVALAAAAAAMIEAKVAHSGRRAPRGQFALFGRFAAAQKTV
jgi:hypothetical protein